MLVSQATSPPPDSNWTMLQLLRQLLAGLLAGAASSAPEPLAGDGRAVAHRLELGPHHVLGHLGVADDGAEAVIGSGHDALAVADGAHGALQPLGDHLRVLDVVVRRLHHAADQGHAIGQLLCVRNAFHAAWPKAQRWRFHARLLGFAQPGDVAGLFDGLVSGGMTWPNRTFIATPRLRNAPRSEE